MDNDSTGKNGGLSLAERARRGDELELHEVMALEFPTAKSYEDRQQPRYKGWQSAIEAAIEFELLVPRKEPRREVIIMAIGGRHTSPADHYGTIIHYWIDRASYQAWRTSQPEPPTSSFISLWLGATPAVETLPPAEPILPALPTLPAEPSRPEPSRPEQTATTARPAEPSIPESIAKGGAAEKSRKTIALVTAENAALVALRKELEREPTAYQWVKYWRDGKDTEGTIKEITKTHVIWIGKDNQTHRTALTTMNTRFTEAKKRNPFKPS